LHYV
jgi:hypothetical protein